MLIELKRRFVLETQGVRLIRSLHARPRSRTAILPASIAASEPGDGWRQRQVAFAWPYSVNLAKLVPVLLADRFDIDFPALGILPRDLWRSASPSHAIADRRFHGEVTWRGAGHPFIPPVRRVAAIILPRRSPPPAAATAPASRRTWRRSWRNRAPNSVNC